MLQGEVARVCTGLAPARSVVLCAVADELQSNRLTRIVVIGILLMSVLVAIFARKPGERVLGIASAAFWAAVLIYLIKQTRLRK